MNTVRMPIIPVLLLLLISGCASLKGTDSKPKLPGQRQTQDPMTVRKEYACDSKPLPFLSVTQNSVAPKTLKRGSEFNHRMVYALCASSATETVRGVLIRRIRYSGHVVFEDKTTDFEMKPGRWTVDAYIGIPKEASPGSYTVEASFESNQISYNGGTVLIVTE
jgi:hypothetical protein